MGGLPIVGIIFLKIVLSTFLEGSYNIRCVSQQDARYTYLKTVQRIIPNYCVSVTNASRPSAKEPRQQI